MRIKHPELGLEAEVVPSAFHKVWSKRGWLAVDQDPEPQPDSRTEPDEELEEEDTDG